MSILYHHIQNVDISRPLLYRLFGMSKVVILTAGHEDGNRLEENQSEGESEGIIDIIDATEAEELQHELLSRSNVMHVEQEVPPSLPITTSEHTS
jgi:uncharacterized membrane protein YdbT with pleckstrin-like domain